MLYTLVFLILFILILTHSQEAAGYAAQGFLLWYSKMIPSLLPFMILSGLMIRMGVSKRLGSWFRPFLGPLLRCRADVIYGVLIGFLCGFPMGARVAAQLYQSGKITNREARFLLAFCNNIGPAYFCSFVLPLLERKLVLPYILGMYGLPLLYGIFLRYTFFRDIPQHDEKQDSKIISVSASPALLSHLDTSVQAGLQSIISLCGYMILFNLLNLIPQLLLPYFSVWIAPLLEITSGLSQLGQSCPLYSLLVLPFGGLSCIAQTYSMIQETDLPLGEYILHKLLLTAFTAIYYLVWALTIPHLFLL